MQHRAQIDGGLVVNIIVVDPDNVPGWCADWPVVPEDLEVGIGSAFETGEFLPPAGEDE